MQNTTYQKIDPARDPAIQSNVQAFLKALNSGVGKPMEEMQPGEARKVLEGAQTSVQVDVSGIDITEKQISQDGLSVKLFIVRPAGVKGTLPAFLFIHGGGWVLGDFPTHKRFVRDLVLYSGVAAVFVEYTRSPEAKYPTAIDEIYAALKWVAANGAEIEVDGKKLAIVGNSVGGNMAAVTALRAKLEKGPGLALQVLFWPVTNADLDTDSYHKYAEGRFLTRNMMKWFWDQYSSADQRNEIYASPLQASLDQLKGLPPAIVQTAENDVLRDEGEAYARKLDQAGVQTTLIRMQGLIHDYGLLNPLANIEAVQVALRQAATEIKKALQ